MTRVSGALSTAIPVVLAAALASPPSRAAEIPFGEGRLTFGGSVFLGTAIRTVSQDTSLLPDINSSAVGIAGHAATATSGRSQDDGNLNYDRGDAVSRVVKATLTLDYRWKEVGVAAGGRAWYDDATARSGRPWGNVPNGYAAGEPLSDSGAVARSRFKGVVVDDLNVVGRHAVGGASIDWTLGYQKLDWGNRLFVAGGLGGLTPVDLPAATRPGALRGQETRIPVPLVRARVELRGGASLETFYQLHFEGNAPNECGTFFSQLDFVAEGCDKVTLGNVSDRTALATGFTVSRSGTRSPAGAGQGGLALRQKVEGWGTDFGLYAAQFHSRASFYSAIKSGRAGEPFVPNDPDGLNPRYFTEYPEEIRMLGATFDTKLRSGTVFGELTYRPNQPLQYNGQDLLNAFASSTAPTPLRERANALAPGSEFHAWERHRALQAQLGATAQVPGVLGANALSLGAQAVYQNVPDLPDPSVTRFGRSDIFGQGPVNGACPSGASPVSCTVDGYVSRQAWGYRLQAGLRYAGVVSGLDLFPSVILGHDVSGWSGDGSILEGRMFAVVSLRADLANGITAEVAWQPTWGGTYNNLRDRGSAQANVGYRF